MTNLTIIANELIQNKIYTEEEIEELMEKYGQLPAATYKEWQKRGYQVKRGEKSILTVFIWKHKDKNIKNEDTDNEEIEQEHFIKTKAYLFLQNQVEELKK